MGNLHEIELSVIIPVYNGMEFLKQTLNSVQKIQHTIEILLIDNNSTDGSDDFCLKYANEFDNIKYLKAEQQGVLNARNTGISNAHGKYVIFVDQDDLVIAQNVDEAINLIDLKKADAVFWEIRRLYSDHSRPGTIIHKYCELNRSQIINNMVLEMLFNRDNTYVSYIGQVWAALYDLDFIKKNSIRFHRFIDIEDDYLFLFDFLLKANKVICFNKVGYYWRFNEKSETYRIKYISHLYEKSIKYYGYIDRALEEIEAYKCVKTKYALYWRQYTILRCAFNELNYYNYTSSRFKRFCIILKKKENRQALLEKPVYSYDTFGRRWVIVFYLLKAKLYHNASLFIRIASK